MEQREARKSAADDIAMTLGRSSARAVKAAGPFLRRLVSRSRPEVERAGREAVRFAREHEEEIKRAAMLAARSRVTGPWGLVLRSLTDSSTPSKHPAAPSIACPSCGAANPPAARFCNQCGGALQA